MLRGVVLVLLVLLAFPAMAREVVKVGGYKFAPYVDLDPAGAPSGLALDLIEALNRYQDRFEFQFVLTSPARRYKDFEDCKFDLVLFESPDWGWTERNLPVDASEVFLDGGEVYVAQAQAGRGQDYFADLSRRRMVGILGYHYGFTGFIDDPEQLARRFRMALVNDNAASIEMILKDRGDVAVVTEAYLRRYLKARPHLAGRLLVSERHDQRYAHRVLTRRGAAPGVGEINRLLAAMAGDGTLERLWRAAGIRD